MDQKANAQQQTTPSLRLNIFSIFSFAFLMAFSAGFYIFSFFCSLIAGFIDVLMYQRIFRVIRSLILLPKTIMNRIAILFQGEQHQQQLHEKYQPKQRNFETSLIRILKNQQLLQGSPDKKLLEELRSSKISLQMQNEELKEKIIEMEYELNDLNTQMEYKNKCMDFMKFDKKKYQQIIAEKQTLENEVEQMSTIVRENQILKENVKNLIERFQSKEQDVQKLEKMLQQYAKKAEEIAIQRENRSKQVNKFEMPETDASIPPQVQIPPQTSIPSSITPQVQHVAKPELTVQQQQTIQQENRSAASKQSEQQKKIIEQQEKKQNGQAPQTPPLQNKNNNQQSKTKSNKNPTKNGKHTKKKGK